MRRGLLLAALLWTVPPFSVHADPVRIRITGGTLDMPDPGLVGGPLGILDIEGFDGFHMVARGDAHNGFGHECAPCAPGDILTFAGSLQAGGYDLLEGGPLPPMPPWQPESLWGYFFEAGTFTVPPLGASAVLTAPFEFSGTLYVHNGFAFPPRELSFELFGRGTGTVELRPNPHGVPVWEFARARYEFEPVPEPATLLLVSTGLGAVAWRRGHRRRTTPLGLKGVTCDQPAAREVELWQVVTVQAL